MKRNLILRNRPENPFLVFQRDFDGIFDNFFLKPVRPAALFDSTKWMPRIDVGEDSGRILVKAELPGINESDLDLTITDNVLTIAGEKKEEEKAEKDGRCIVSERFFGSFSRSITLPAGVQADKIKAEFKGGVLNIEIPLEESKQSRKIAIH